MIGSLAARLWSGTCVLRLAGLVRSLTDSRATDPADLTTAEARLIIEELKASLDGPPTGYGPPRHRGGLARGRLATSRTGAATQ